MKSLTDVVRSSAIKTGLSLLLSMSPVIMNCSKSSPTGSIGNNNGNGSNNGNNGDELVERIDEIKGFSARKDTYVSSLYPTRTYGSASFLVISPRNWSETRVYVYIPFSLPSGSTVDGAKLTIFRDVEPADNRKLQVWACPLSESFSESGTTWNNKPLEYQACALTEIDGSQGVYGISWDVTRFVRDMNSGLFVNRGFSLRPKGTGEAFVFRSREDRASPQIIIKYHYTR